MIFPVVVYGCESWTIKKAEHQRIDAFELWCWRRLLRVPWTARRSNQYTYRKSVLNIHWKDWCWSWNPSTLATWCKELTHLKRPWCWEILKAGGEGDDRGWDGWMASPTQWTWVWVSSGSRWWTGKPGVLHTVHGVSKSKTELSDWTELNITCNMFAIKMLLMPQIFQFTIETEKQFTNYLLFALDFIYLSALNLKYLFF